MIIRLFFALCAILVFRPFDLVAQDRAPIQLRRENVADNLDSLQAIWGKRKNVPEEFLIEFYTAISHFPELTNVRIKVKCKNEATTMAARPGYFSALRKPSKRKYILFVSADSTLGIPLVHDFTFNARVGLFGHEFSHITDYLGLSTRGLVRTGKSYRKDNAFKADMEKRTDRIAIEHGLGWQLYDFATQLQALQHVSAEYKLFKKKTYLTPAEIFSIMGDLGYDL